MAIDPTVVDFVWGQAEARLEAQIRQAEALDTKAAALAGLQGVAAGILVALGQRVHHAGRWLTIAALSILLMSLAYSLAAFFTHRYVRSPGPRELWRYADRSATELRYAFLSTRFGALDENHAKLEVKATRLDRGLKLFGLVLFMAGIGAIGGLTP